MLLGAAWLGVVLVVAGIRGDQHVLEDAGFGFLLVGVPLAVAGLTLLALGYAVARGWRWTGLPFIPLVAVGCLITGGSDGNALSAVRTILEGGSVSADGLALTLTTTARGPMNARLDDPGFWAPAVVALLGVAVGLLLVLPDGRKA